MISNKNYLKKTQKKDKNWKFKIINKWIIILLIFSSLILIIAFQRIQLNKNIKNNNNSSNNKFFKINTYLQKLVKSSDV